LPEWANVDARRTKVEQKIGDPSVFRRLGIGTGKKHPEVSMMGHA
jgi:hypothetical protein